MMTPILAILYLGGLLAAAGWDLVSYTIPNRLVAVLAAGGLAALGLLAGDWLSVGWHLGVGLAVLVAGGVMFAVHLWGAGDAKLLAAVALWTGPGGLSMLVFWTVMFGGVIAVVLLVARRLRFINKSRLKPWCQALLSPTQGIPYGVAIAAGGIAAFISHHTVLAEAVLAH